MIGFIHSRIGKSALAVLAVICFNLLNPGCGRRSSPAVEASVLRYPLAMDMSTFDPAVNEAADTADVIQNIYEGLLTLDEKTRPIPCLAEKWDISADGKKYTFHLDPRAKFHTPFERPVTAADIKYSMERAFWPETRATVLPLILEDIVGAKEASRGKRRDLPGVEVVDDQTLTVTLERPRGYMLMELATSMVVCREAIERSGGRLNAKAAIGTGPFRLVEYLANNRVVLEANPTYYRGAPKLARIERPIVLDPQTIHSKYENGEIDLCAPAFQDFVTDQQDPRLKAEAKVINAAGVNYIVMHPRSLAAFRDARVRRAFAMAIDRDEIVRVAFHGIAPRADAFLAPGVVGHDPHAPRIPHDPEAARKLLAEAGFPGGRGFPKLTLVYRQQVPQIEAAAALIRDDLKRNLGIEPALQAREAATFFADLDRNAIPFHVVRWMAVDPHDYLTLLLRTGARFNTVGYSNPAFDRLVDAADAELDPEKRAEAYRQADRQAMADVAVLPLNYEVFPYLIKPKVRDLGFNLAGMMPHYRTYIQP